MTTERTFAEESMTMLEMMRTLTDMAAGVREHAESVGFSRPAAEAIAVESFRATTRLP